MQQRNEDRSLGELFGDLARETGTLVRQEVELAKTEMGEKAARVGREVGILAAGGLVAYAGFLVLLFALVAGLVAAGMPVWLAGLIVGIVVAGVGYLLVQRGLSAVRRTSLAPTQTVETLKDDVEWAKEQVR